MLFSNFQYSHINWQNYCASRPVTMVSFRRWLALQQHVVKRKPNADNVITAF